MGRPRPSTTPSEGLRLAGAGRVPLGLSSVRTIEHAVDLSFEVESSHLYFLQVNLIYKGDRVRREELARAVESAIGPHENASYHVRNAFLLEEAILYEAVQQDADYVVIGRDTKARWRQVLADRLDQDIDLDPFLCEHLGAKLVVV